MTIDNCIMFVRKAWAYLTIVASIVLLLMCIIILPVRSSYGTPGLIVYWINLVNIYFVPLATAVEGVFLLLIRGMDNIAAAERKLHKCAFVIGLCGTILPMICMLIAQQIYDW